MMPRPSSVCALLLILSSCSNGDDPSLPTDAGDAHDTRVTPSDASFDDSVADTSGPTCDGPTDVSLGGGIIAKFASSASGGGGGGFGPDGWHYTHEFGDGGFIELHGPTGNPADGEVNGLGVLALPTDATDPGAHFCAGDGTTVTRATSGTYSFVLRNVVRLGACAAGVVGTDTVDGCFTSGGTVPDAGSGSATCVKDAMHLVGTIDGAPIDATIVDASGGLSTGGPAALRLGLDGYLDLRGTTDATGTIILPTTISPGPIVRCVAAGSTSNYDSDALRFHLVLARLGSCAPAASNTAPIEGCSR